MEAVVAVGDRVLGGAGGDLDRERAVAVGRHRPGGEGVGAGARALEAPFVQFEEVPPIVTSLVVESKPVTDSLKLTEQLKLVLLDGLALGRHDKDAVGFVRSSVYI